MADTTITITIPEAQWELVQQMFSEGVPSPWTTSDVTGTFVKQALISYLTDRIRSYEERSKSVDYSSFSPS